MHGRGDPTAAGTPAAPPIAGIWPAVLTMFDAAGDSDEEATARHVNDLLRSGAHGLVAAGRVPVYAGTGHLSTRHTTALTDRAERAGAAGVPWGRDAGRRGGGPPDLGPPAPH